MPEGRASVSPLSVVDGREFRMLIGDDLVGSSDGGTRPAVDPSTGREISTVPEATREDVQRAVAAADRAHPEWAALGVYGRDRYFQQLADAVSDRAEELAVLDAVNAGNPVQAMRDDVEISVQQLRAWPGLASGLTGKTIPSSQGNLHYTLRQPYGVVARIVPFNHPAMFAITRILPALIAGNTVVLKPAHQTPLSALVFGEIVRQVCPPGVVNIIAGGSEAGQALVTHPTIKRIAFTGSVSTGRAIQRTAAQAGIKHVSLELGGKNPMIVFPDTDLEDVVDGAVFGMNFGVCQGQSCGSNSRVYVHESLYEPFLERLAARLEKMIVGPAYDSRTEMGPLVTRDHYERVWGFVEAGRTAGARLITGGSRPAGLDAGYFLAPTVFADVSADMSIGREEIFGPVISVFPWTDYDDVIAAANDTEYGLTASVWTNDIHLAHRTAERLQAGYVWINDSTTHYWGTPFGGWKASGTGREECVEELESYLELKAVHTILKSARDAFHRMAPDGRT